MEEVRTDTNRGDEDIEFALEGDCTRTCSQIA
jgi:hypothetical protein